MKKSLAILLITLLLLQLLPAYSETLKQGSRGNEVEAVQQRLIDLGYLSGKADGIYGKNTADAVSLFQFFARIPETGKIDADTLAALRSDDARALIPSLKSGDEGDAVLALQRKLKLLGFLTDEPDGIYGKNTVSAVRAFQSHLIDQGLQGEGLMEITATGKASSMTQEYLFSANYSVYLRDFSVGDEADSILRAERRLAELGYLDAKPSDSFDDYTAAVVSAFQTAEGLNASGMLDRATIDTLFSEAPAAADRFVPHAVSVGDSGETVRAAQRVLIRYGMLANLADGVYGDETETALEAFHACLAANGDPRAVAFEARGTLSVEAQNLLAEEEFFHYTEDVLSGASADEIKRVQRRLHTLYYLDRAGTDGKAGKETTHAISLFQENNGLEVTGIADEATQRILFSDEAIGNFTPYKLVISIAEQRVHVYALTDGEYEYVESFICSTGLNNSTPRGIFLNTGRISYWHYFEKFDCWAQYSYQIDGSILFHSVLYDEQNPSTLRTGSLYALGSKASHGCVRLQVEDAEWIFENCKKGTIVEIY